MPAREQHRRSLTKSITYRLLSITVDTCVAYFFTHNVAFSLTIVAVVNSYSTALYYLHERVWTRINWGHKESAV